MEESEIIKTALEAEKTSLITYLDFARKTRDESGKNMFIRLAMDEFSHMRLLEEQKENLLNKGDWVKVEVERSKLEELVPKLKEKTVKTKSISGMDEIDALNIALQLEDKAAKYYREQAKIENELAKEMFKRLAEMEDTHYQLIQAELDYIQNTGYWFGIREFTQE